MAINFWTFAWGAKESCTKLLPPSSHWHPETFPTSQRGELPHSPGENVVGTLLLWDCLRPREVQSIFNKLVWIHYKTILCRSIPPTLSIFIENIGIGKLRFLSQCERQINISVESKKLLLKSNSGLFLWTLKDPCTSDAFNLTNSKGYFSGYSCIQRGKSITRQLGEDQTRTIHQCPRGRCFLPDRTLTPTNLCSKATLEQGGEKSRN